MTFMNSPEVKLKELVHVEKGIIPSTVCNYTIKTIEKQEWKPHVWHSNKKQKTYILENSTDLEIQYATQELQNLMNPYLRTALSAFWESYHFKSEKTLHGIGKISPLRFNRYSLGQDMPTHHDHIHSLFDGKEKGIPVLSIIGNLNSDYEGATLTFWEKYPISLGEGDIVIFPSLFLFPHKVTKVEKNKRYSFVCWGW